MSESIQERLRQVADCHRTAMYVSTREISTIDEAANVIDGLVAELRLAKLYVMTEAAAGNLVAKTRLPEIDKALSAAKGGSQ